ncbi:hypothetical protein HYT59_01955 [Candidatus Woesebacteria bacterium]|nr:hypothetical protein [Candidatus Woesebacteria bacterium]
MRYGYSRQQASEQRQNIKSAGIYIVLTIGAILLILFFGIPLIGKIAAFFHDLRTSNQPIDTNDTTPPAPPTFETLPEFTNKTVIEVVGRTEGGAIVKLSVNDKEEEVIANNEGAFNYKWSLWKGENKISAKARDSAGNESQDSEVRIVQYDNEPPSLEITSPENNASFGGTRARQVTIEGKTESRASVTINDRIVAVDQDGSFTFFTTLSDGQNNFTIKAKDRAGNETEKSLTVNFTP